MTKIPEFNSDLDETPKAKETAPAQELIINQRTGEVAATDGKICAILPRNLDEAWRLANSFFTAGMIPSSYKANTDKETIARVMLGICKGLEIGLPPITAISNIMIINNKPCLYGDGASSLVNGSGAVEYIKTEVEGSWADKTYKVTVRGKRKDQTEEIVRSFSYDDAKRANLLGKTGPWQTYPERQCYWRAWSWMARDAFSDALHGMSVREEVIDFEVEEKRNRKIDTSDLNDGAVNA
jgi:hypothetical protein